MGYTVEALERRTLLSVSQYPIDLQLNGQGLFGTNSSVGTSFNFNQFLGVQWQGMSGAVSVWPLSASAGVSPSKVGFQLTGSGGLGTASIADYPVNAQFSAPGSAAPGSTVTVATSNLPDASGYTLETTATTLPSAELDFVMSGSVSGSLAYGSSNLFSDSLPLNLTDPLITLGAGQLGGSLSAGPLGVTLAAPDLPALLQSAAVGSMAKASGPGDNFISADLDISQIITDLLDVPLDFKGSLGPVSWQTELLAIDINAGLPLTESVQFVPNVTITLTSNDGQTHTGALGQSFNFTMPAHGGLNLSATVQLGGSLQTTVGLGGNLSVDLKALDSSVNIPLIGNHSIGPVWAATPYSASGNLVNLYSTSGFSISNSPSIAPKSAIPNAVRISALDGAPAGSGSSGQPAVTNVDLSNEPIQVFGTGFTQSSTELQFTFNNGVSFNRTGTYKSPTEIDYNFAADSKPGPWTVQVVGSSGPSNAFAFTVGSAAVDTSGPMASLVGPGNLTSVVQSAFNQTKNILVTYTDVGSGIDPASITDNAAEFSLSGPGVGTAVMTSGAGTLVSGTTNTYAYNFSGAFATGLVTVTFPAGSFADLIGNPNSTITQSFTITSSSVPTGGLQETITPQAAINAGAQWRVDGGSYYSSGAVASGLAAGTHTVQFKPISGWTTPPNQSLTVVAGTTIPYTTAYTQPQLGPYTISITADHGSILRSPAASSFAAGTTVTLTAQPDIGQHFTGWTGSVTSSQNPLTLTMDSDKTLTANYAAADSTHGGLQVNITPASAVAAGALWSIDGGNTYYDPGALLPILAAGIYNVQFYPLGGFTRPSTQTVTVSAGQTTTINAAYIPDPQFGMVQVAISPSAAVAAGAQWQIDGGGWNGNGASLSGMTVGTHQIAFSNLAGWETPPSQTIQVNVDSTSIVNASYAAPVGVPLISSISPPTGPLSGGTQVIIVGVNFESGAAVSFGGVAATNVIVDSPTELRATTPARTSYGSVAVVVTTSGGTATNSNGFVYSTPLGHGVELAGHFGGENNAVLASGSFVYLGDGTGLAVLNVSNPAQPVVLSRLTLPGQAWDFALSGQYLYVADGAAGLQIVNVSSPASPQLVGFYSMPGFAGGVALLGGRAYVADGSAGLQILDLGSPIAPTFVGSVAANHPGKIQLAVSSGHVYAYLSFGDGNMTIADVSDPANPIIAGTINTSTNTVCDAAMSGDTLYLADRDSNSVLIYDVASPSSPLLLGTVYTLINYSGMISPCAVQVAGRRLYVHGSAGVDLYDVSNPASPQKLAEVSAAGGGNARLFLNGSQLYDSENGLTIINTSNPNTLSVTGAYSNPLSYAARVAVSGNTAYLYDLNGTAGLATVDVSNPAAPLLEGSIDGGGYVQDMAIVGNRAYVSWGAFVSILDISNPSSPESLGTYTDYSTPTNPHGIVGYYVAATGTTVYAAAWDDATHLPVLKVLNANNPAAISQVSSVQLSTDAGMPSGILISGTYAYVTVGQNIYVVDISSAAAPQVVSTVVENQSIEAVAVTADGSHLVVGSGNAIQIVDVRNPSNPTTVASYALADYVGWYGGISISGNRAYIAANSAGIIVLDITDPTQPTSIATYAAANRPWALSVSGDYIYVADQAGGLQVLHMLDITPPTVTITNPTAASAYTTTTGTINLGGAASDDRQLAQVVWSNNRGGSGTATGTTSWLATGVVLQPGANVLTATAYDASGNIGTDVLTVTYSPIQSAQTITFPALTNHTFGDGPVTLNATVDSGLPVAFTVVSGPATVSGNTLAITGAGTVVVDASQPGNAYYTAATDVQRSFTVAMANQTVSFVSLPTLTFGDAPFGVDAIASSGLPVTLSINSGPATIANGIISLTGAGTVVLQASQSGDSNYNAATDVVASFSVAKAPQFIAFGAMSNQSSGDAPFPVTASASSGLPVVFAVSGPATISGNIITVTGAGTVKVTAAQPGDANYAAAASVSQSFVVSGATAAAAAPVFSQKAGNYIGSTTVVLTSPTAGAVIHYTVNGTTPTASSPVYSTALSIKASETVKAIAIKSGMANSAVSSAALTIVQKSSITTLISGKAISSLSGAAGSQKFFQIVVPTGKTKLTISITGGTGDANVYLRRTYLPSTGIYDSRSILAGNGDSITVLKPAAGTYYLLLYGNLAFSGATVKAILS